MNDNDVRYQIMTAYTRFYSRPGNGGWNAIAKILGVQAGSAYWIGHGKRELTDEQRARWLEHRKPQVRKEYWRPCLPIEWKDRLTTDGLIALVNEGYRARHVVTATLIEGPEPAFWEYLGIPTEADNVSNTAG